MALNLPNVHEYHGQSPAMPFGLLHPMFQSIIWEYAIG